MADKPKADTKETILVLLLTVALIAFVANWFTNQSPDLTAEQKQGIEYSRYYSLATED